MKKRYWLRGMLFGVVISFFVIFFVERNNLFVYSFRQQHPYLTTMHRIIADAPTYIALIVTPSFCKPVINQYESSSCWESFFNISYIIEFLEIVFVGTIVGWTYGKIKNRNIS